MTRRRKAFFSLVCLLLAYATAEAVATTLYLRGDLEPASLWIHEVNEGASTIQFDPITGYRLTQTPARMACIASNGVVESVGTLRGNNRGFPDRDDFTAKKTDPSRRRFAVFGDSFSSAQFLQRNWPDRCEELARKAGAPVDLLNFSIDGGGYINWWTTLRGIVGARDYEIDGVIFAVYGNDLRRPFVIWDDRVIPTGPDGRRTIGFGTVHTFETAELPRTLEEAVPYFHGLPRWQILPAETLDRMLRGEIRPTDNRPFRFYLAHRLSQAIGRLSSTETTPHQYTPADVDAFDSDYPGRRRIWSDIRRDLETRRVPALVVDIPSRNVLLQGGDSNAEAAAFAQFIGATLVDGTGAFKGLSQDEVRACWLPYDGHWGQTGSDRFAAFMLEVISNWLPREEEQGKTKPHQEAAVETSWQPDPTQGMSSPKSIRSRRLNWAA